MLASSRPHRVQAQKSDLASIFRPYKNARMCSHSGNDRSMQEDAERLKIFTKCKNRTLKSLKETQ